MNYSRSTFQPLEGKTFFIGNGEQVLQADLIDISDMLETDDGVMQSRQFSLVWRGPADKILDQGTYTVSHPDIGDLELFLVTIGPDESGMRYEAVFT